VAQTAEIAVNHPAAIEGIKLYQFGYGWGADLRKQAPVTRKD
jgi:cytochrome c biogenesis protein ResB